MLTAHLGPVLPWLLSTSVSAAVIACLVFTTQVAFGRWLTPIWRYRLWWLVVLRLLLPALPASPTSLWNLDVMTPIKTLLARWTQPPPGAVAATKPPIPPAPAAADSQPQVAVSLANAPPHVHKSVVSQSVGGEAMPRWRGLVALPYLLTAVWLAGATLLLARLIGANVMLARRLRQVPPSTDPTMLGLLEECCRVAGILRPPPLLVTDTVRAPSAAGLWRPRILIPPGLFGALTLTEQRDVLLHELTHLRCRDVAGNWLLALIQVAHWFNPALWLAFARLRTDREAARDTMVLRLACRGDPATAARLYARTLLKLTGYRSSGSAYAPAVAGILSPASTLMPGLFASRSALQRRLHMIARFPHAPGRFAMLGPMVALGLASCTLTGARQSTPRHTDGTPTVTTQPGQTVAEQQPPSKPATQSIQANLNRKIPELSFDEVGFGEVVDFLRGASGANLFVDWKSLEAAGISRNTPVSARMRNISFSKALSVILDAASGGNKKLGFRVEDGVITITTADELSKNVTVRVYDIRDLLVTVPDFIPQVEAALGPSPASHPAARVGGVTTPQTASTHPASRDELVEQIIALIEDTVATDSWKARGGSVGALRELQGQLIVTQTPENQRELANLLEQLRETRSIQVQIEARYVACDEQVVKGLIAEWQKTAAPMTRPILLTHPTTRQDAAGIFLDDAQVNQLLRASEKAPNSAVLAAPRITLFNGQRAYVRVTSLRAYVRDYTAVRTPQGDIRYDPVNAVAESGLAMDVQATASADRRYVTLTLRPMVSALLGMKRTPWLSRPSGSNLIIEEPRIKVSEMQTTVTVPDHATVLLGGLEDPGIGASSAPATQATSRSVPLPGDHLAGHLRAIFLMVKPHLIIQHETQQKSFPRLSPKTGQ